MKLWVASLLAFKNPTLHGVDAMHTQAYAFCRDKVEARSVFKEMCKKEYPESEGYFDHDVSVGEVPVKILPNSR